MVQIMQIDGRKTEKGKLSIFCFLVYELDLRLQERL